MARDEQQRFPWTSRIRSRSPAGSRPADSIPVLGRSDPGCRKRQGRARDRLRQQTVEPVFGIIKAVLGFTGFSPRSLDKVAGEWDLVALAYNCKRIHKLKLEMAS